MRPTLILRSVHLSTFQTALASIVLATLVAALALSQIVPPLLPWQRPAPSGYSQQVDSLLKRYDTSVSQLNTLLDQRDANPALSESATWRQSLANVDHDLTAEYNALRTLNAPPADRPSHTCLDNTFRLTAEGASLLRQGFLTDGHGAYYFGSHGNWDLNLASVQRRQCQVSGN